MQEAAGKFPPLRADYTFTLHLIGGLQTNKARDAVRMADVIETLDRPQLADAIASARARERRSPTLLVEVNVGNEETEVQCVARRTRMGSSMNARGGSVSCWPG